MPAVKTILVIGASGYIGARLSHDLAAAGYAVAGCDLEPSAHPGHFSQFWVCPYQELSDQALAGADLVLWFAGHSSVKKAQDDPWGSMENNVFDLARLFRRLATSGTPMVYASSASVCSSENGQFHHVANEHSANAYDASKLALDVMLKQIGHRVLGLRMSTLAGWSPVMRWDTIFNAMNRTSYSEKKVRVTNASNFRSLLFIDDLSAYIQTLAAQPERIAPEPAIVPLGCWSGSIGTIAAEIAGYWNVPIEFGGNEGTYSFVIDDRNMHQALAPEIMYISMAQRCERFARQHEWRVPG